jgi:hypothetical protein
MTAPKLSPVSSRLALPASPVPVHSEIRDAAAAVIEAEQWLQSNGWRQSVIELGSPHSETYLAGYARFRARVLELRTGAELELEGAVAEARIWRRVAFAAAGVAVLGFVLLGVLVI